MLVIQNNLANTYQFLERHEKALSMYQQVYSAFVKFHGEEHKNTLDAANNYAVSLTQSNRYREAKALLSKTIPVVRRVLGDSNELTLQMRWNYGGALLNRSATLDDLSEAVTTLEDTTRIARRVMGGAHPLTTQIEISLRRARAALVAAEQS